MMAFADHLVEANRDLWMAMVDHPLVLGLADGTLPDGALQAWVQQDRILVVEERWVLAALRAHGLPSRLDDLLADLDRSLVLEAEAFARTAERAYLDTWTAVAERSRADSAYHAWIRNWTGEPFRAFVGDLGRGLDELAGAPSPALAQRLGVLFARAARFELAFWEMCWSGQAWPA
jgi:thiaminase